MPPSDIANQSVASIYCDGGIGVSIAFEFKNNFLSSVKERQMDLKGQVTKWVENKIGNVITKDLKEKVVEENSSFDVETYADNLLDRYFSENCIEQLQEILNQDSYDDLIYSELEYFTEEQNSSNNSLEFDSNDFQPFLEEEIIKDLESNSQEVKKKSLRILETAAEDFINHASWNVVFDGLQKTLSTASDREIHILVLKIFQKLLKCSKKSQTICNGFTGTAKLIAKQLAIFNLENEKILVEQTYPLKENERQLENNLESDTRKHWNGAYPEVLIKLMWLLVDCQQQMSARWIRFNETRFREIIFSFVHLLSSTTVLENKKLSGLELLSVLNPTASWCYYYCHTAVGRSLLCSALKKYKTFFTHIVEIIINHIKTKRANRLPSLEGNFLSSKTPRKFKNDVSGVLRPINKVTNTEKGKDGLKEKHLGRRNNRIRLASDEQSGVNTYEDGKTKNSNLDWMIKAVPRRVVAEAVFCHSVSFVTCLIRYRSGRALFPLHTKIRRRLLSIQDFSLYLIDYLENIEYYERDETEITFTSSYKAKLSEIKNILKSVTHRINSSRRAERQTFSYP